MTKFFHYICIYKISAMIFIIVSLSMLCSKLALAQEENSYLPSYEEIIQGYFSKKTTDALSNIIIHVASDITPDDITETLYLIENRIKTANLKSVGKDVVKGLAEDIISDAISDYVYKKTKSNFARGSAWFLTKEIFAAKEVLSAYAGIKNQSWKTATKKFVSIKIKIAQAQAGILADTVKKTVDEANILKISWGQLIGSNTHAELQNIHQKYIDSYVKGTPKEREDVKQKMLKEASAIIDPEDYYYRGSIAGHVDIRKNAFLVPDKGKIKIPLVNAWKKNLSLSLSTEITQRDDVLNSFLEAGEYEAYDSYVSKWMPSTLYAHYQDRKGVSITSKTNQKLIPKRNNISQKSHAQQRVVESLKASTQKLESLSKQINTNQSKIRLLEKELASLAGNSNGVSRISQAQIRVAKIRELRLKMFWNLYNKYDGDLSKVSPNDKIRLYTLAKSFDGSWKELFSNSPALYESAKQERIRLVSSSNGSGSDKARILQSKIKNLRTKVTILANAAQKKEIEYRSLFTQYQSNQNEIATLISDINDTAKEDIASSSDLSLTNPFYGIVSFLGNGATIGTFEGYFAASTSNDFSSSNQNTSFRAGDANMFITPDINTGSGNHFTDGYQYVAWGQWNSNGHQIVEGTDTNNALGGYWVLGQQAYNVPTQGTATYSGDMRGDYINAAGNAERGTIGGSIGFNVDFSQNTIGGNGSLTLHNNPVDTFNFDPINLGDIPNEPGTGGDRDSVPTSSEFDSSYWFFANQNQINTNSGQNMTIGGSLHGNEGTEISGGFQWGAGNSGDENSASGVFRAQCTGGACQ